MILQRFSIALRKQDWWTVTIELFIVVLGVFLGLQAQEWSDRQQDQRREVQILSDMLTDLDLDREQYASTITVVPRRVGAATASLVGAGLSPIEFDWRTNTSDVDNYAFDVSRAIDYPKEDFDRLWTDIVLGFHPTPSTSAYDAMIGSGDIRILRDREIVRAIQAYNGRISTVLEQNQKLLAIRAEVLKTGARYGLAPYARTPADEYFRLLASEPELAATIRNMATFVIFHYDDVRRADEQAAGLQQRLRDYLETIK